MTHLVDQARAALAAPSLNAAGHPELSLVDGGLQFHSELTALDSIACEFVRFELTSAALANANLERLKAVSQDLSARLTYLLEPIRPIEIDGEQCVVQLRSQPPEREADRSSYYELLVRRGGHLSLCRWTKTPGDVRQAIPAQVTREVFLRLIRDFSSAAA